MRVVKILYVFFISEKQTVCSSETFIYLDVHTALQPIRPVWQFSYRENLRCKVFL